MADKWRLSGTYFEACNCEAACQCVFLGPPDPGECTILVGWHIDSGTMGDVSLDGLNVDSFVERPVRDGPWGARVSGREAPRAVGC